MIKFVDICAGIGGLSRPLHMSGHACVLAVEIDKWARQTYLVNYPGTPMAEDVTSLHEHSVPDHDVLLAGFPCQPFSSVGKLRGFEDTRGTIIFDILRIVNHKRPKYLVFENVRGLLRHDKGKTFSIIIDSIRSLGYNVQHVVLDARVYVPQKRRRVFIVASCDDLPMPTLGHLPHADPTPARTLAEVLWRPTDEARFSPNHFVLTPATLAWLQAHKQRKIASGGLETINFVTADDLAATLTARYHKDGKEIVYVDPIYGHRKLTPRECARLMGFDDSFILPPTVSSTQLHKQMGNSVVVPCAEEIMKAIGL